MIDKTKTIFEEMVQDCHDFGFLPPNILIRPKNEKGAKKVADLAKERPDLFGDDVCVLSDWDC